MFVTDQGTYKLGVSAEGLPSLGLLQRFAWNFVRWSKFKFSFRILSVLLSVHNLNKLRNMTRVRCVVRLGKTKGKYRQTIFCVGQRESDS
jgi:hypothetical protein